MVPWRQPCRQAKGQSAGSQCEGWAKLMCLPVALCDMEQGSWKTRKERNVVNKKPSAIPVKPSWLGNNSQQMLT